MRDLSHPSLHPAGEQPPVEDKGPLQGVSLDSFAGPVHVEWDTEAALTPLGQLPFFIDFLKAAGLFDAFVADCPLRYTSLNAPKKRDVLRTTMLSMLSGHKRYAHIAALRCDSVLPELLGMNKIISDRKLLDAQCGEVVRGIGLGLFLRRDFADPFEEPAFANNRDTIGFR